MKDLNRNRLRYRRDPRVDRGIMDSSYRYNKWKKFNIQCPSCRYNIASIKELKKYKWKYLEGSSYYIIIEYKCPSCGWLIFKDRIFYKKEEYIR
uniref:Uncharacterized protein n=1 Tax=viral metagenome TaxID=1070528 RepID=A0A6H1ZZJ7_9ZZZZ